MTSMTGYGTAVETTEDFSLEVEVKSYNNRFLDIDHTIPFYLAPYEIEIDHRVGKVAKRGHVEVNVKVRNLKHSLHLAVDSDAVAGYAEAFARIADVAGKALRPTLADFVNAQGVLTSLDEVDGSHYEAALFSALDKALAQFSAAKKREGAATREDLVRLGAKIKDGLAAIKLHAAELEKLVGDNVRQRLDEMLGDQNYDENRIIQETAIMVVRFSVNEEIRRLETHLKAYDRTLDLDEPVGKQLDFLCQEMNREINTIGSKSQIAEMNLQVVKMKDGLEDIREQIRNIE